MSKCKIPTYPVPSPDEDKKVRPVNIGCINRYDRKILAESGRISPTEVFLKKEVLGCFDLYRRKLKGTGVDPSANGVEDRYKSFIHALSNSYNSERVRIVEKEEIFPHYEEDYLSLITPDEKRGIKNVAIPFDLYPSVGKMLYWVRENSYWLITTREETEKAYFKGTIEKCNYILSWRDDNGNLYRQRVKLQGAVETKYKNENLGEFIGGKPNETNTIWMARTKQTEHLRRYKKLLINGRAYEIAVTDDVSPIIELHLIEGYINPSEDLFINGEEIAGGNIQIDYRFSTNLDQIGSMKVGDSLTIEPLLYKDDELITAKPYIEVNEFGKVEGNIITALSPGEMVIKICYENYPVSKSLKINVVQENTASVSYYELSGPSEMYLYSQGEVQLKSVIDGVTTLLNPMDIKILPESLPYVEPIYEKDSLVLKTKKLGMVKLKATVNGQNIFKEVKIVSPW